MTYQSPVSSPIQVNRFLFLLSLTKRLKEGMSYGYFWGGEEKGGMEEG